MPVKVGLKHIERWNESLENQVLRYESEPIRKGEIVFYGPSHFTRWSERWGFTPLREAVLGKSGAQCCINRGFGSSCSEHQLYYYPRMVRPLEPSVLVYYCFGNGAAFGYTHEETWEIAQRVIAYAQADFPGIRIYICGLGGSPGMSDETRARKVQENSYIVDFVKNNPNCFYINILDCEPLNSPDVFVADGVHYNEKGYRLFAEFFREQLKDELDRF